MSTFYAVYEERLDLFISLKQHLDFFARLASLFGFMSAHGPMRCQCEANRLSRELCDISEKLRRDSYMCEYIRDALPYLERLTQVDIERKDKVAGEGIDQFVTIHEPKVKKGTIFAEYMSQIEKNGDALRALQSKKKPLPSDDDMWCRQCEKCVKKAIMDREAIMVCISAASPSTCPTWESMTCE